MQLQNFHSDLDSLRHQLLQTSLRETPTEYPIEQEYPLVLGKQYADRSLCLTMNQDLLAHVNLWKRKIVDTVKEQDLGTIGLIGNVATSPLYRGRGIMSEVIEEVQDRASEEGLKGLVLWSDLSTFYSKLGFRFFGEEQRFLFSKTKLDHYAKSDFYKFVLIPQQMITPEIIHICLGLRIPTQYTLERSAEEMIELLKIPDTSLVLAIHESERVLGFFILGRGYDMIAVIHEWGAVTPKIMLDGIRYIFWGTNLEQLTLLSPAELNADWAKSFGKLAQEHRVHPVGLIWTPTLSNLGKDFLNQFYIWGLDSI